MSPRMMRIFKRKNFSENTRGTVDSDNVENKWLLQPNAVIIMTSYLETFENNGL